MKYIIFMMLITSETVFSTEDKWTEDDAKVRFYDSNRVSLYYKEHLYDMAWLIHSQDCECGLADDEYMDE